MLRTRAKINTVLRAQPRVPPQRWLRAFRLKGDKERGSSREDQEFNNTKMKEAPGEHSKRMNTPCGAKGTKVRLSRAKLSFKKVDPAQQQRRNRALTRRCTRKQSMRRPQRSAHRLGLMAAARSPEPHTPAFARSTAGKKPSAVLSMSIGMA